MIDRITENISYKHFKDKYLFNNTPCVFSNNLTENWNCSKDWIKNGKLNVEYFENTFGNEMAPVMDCNVQYFSSHKKTDMKVFDYMKYWRHRDERLLYLKDWHMQRLDIPSFYQVPYFFCSDWLNEYFDSEGNDDYRFVYIGVKNSWTPFHADVFQSYSWSANICGLKKWIFLQPGEEEKLKDATGNLPFDISNLLDKNEKVKFYTVYQKTGEIIFVPSGWYHQVFNLEDTVSINHNWINASSIKYFWKHLTLSLELVKKEINDCFSMSGFQEQCQLILLSLSGINYEGFLKMLCYLAKKRLTIVEELFNESECLEILFISSQPQITEQNNELTRDDKFQQLEQDLKQLHQMLLTIFKSTDSQTVINSYLLQETERLILRLEKTDYSVINQK